MTCPACASDDTALVLHRDAVPVHQNQVHRDLASAREAPTGTLALRACHACGHAWNAAFDPDRVAYHEAYDNRQEHSPAFRAWLAALADDLIDAGCHDADVVEVGCGWGHFLRLLCTRGANRGIGFDPAYRGPRREGPIRFVRAYYGPEHAGVPADWVLCRHVIEHVPDPLALARAVAGALRGHTDARIAFECPDARWIVDNDVPWDVFFEHAHYFTPASLAAVFARAGFTGLQVRPAFGGQYQLLIGRPGPAVPSLGHDGAALDWHAWAARTAVIEARWQARVEALAADGPVVLWGAGAKGVTLAHRVDPDASRLAALVDVNPGKQGGFTPVSAHPIVAPDALPALGARHAIVMNPAYLAEIRAHVRRKGWDVALHPPELPCASSSMTKLAS